MIIEDSFFDRDCVHVAKELIGKVLRRMYKGIWLSAAIVETEAYYKQDKASHASLGISEKKRALFMPPGTIYMYYARGKDSLNFSCKGPGNAVLIKSARIFVDRHTPCDMIKKMQILNPIGERKAQRPISKLCSGQTLLCKALDLKVPVWDKKTLCKNEFFIEDVGYRPKQLINAKRLGIPKGRDEHLFYRFVDFKYSFQASQNMLTSRKAVEGEDYFIMPI